MLGVMQARLMSVGDTMTDPFSDGDVIPYSSFVRWAASQGFLDSEPPLVFVEDEELGRLLRLTMLVQKPPSRMLLLLKIYFDPARGFAPVKITGVDGVYDDEGVLKTFTQERYVGVWSEFVEPAAGLFVARHLRIESWVKMVSPESGEFVALLKDGVPVKKNGLVQVDLSKTFEQEFHKGAVDCRVLHLAVNGDQPEDLCEQEFATGTIVEDRVNGQAYQLTGPSPAIDAKLRKALSARTQRAPAPKSNRRMIWIASVNAVVLIAMLAFASRKNWRRSKSE